ncbi:hypothetical protein BEP19_02550 [Ammoniphilus oxalaticus]|uniref:Probable membrane transporter protein n=1 Tax=Ammoniphilus oxalaticus TaxID=66863 RepID=A0A419SNF3_9BACL|nr:sulfite exporter TauE/SafE family protein [Ammoniphilus oxalaticus]RKD25834.1 hypothetical protein BEP19_02550 [Ammoniphilus oxalaticus]
MDLIALILIIFMASLLQSSTGFGFSIVGTPFLFLVYSAHTAIQINIILSLFLSVFMMRQIRDGVNKLLLWNLIKGSLPGVVGGILIYLHLPMTGLKRSVGFLILILTILLILNVTIRRTTKRDAVTGAISGLLTASIGVPGPPLLLYFAGSAIKKEELRSTTLAYYLFIYSISLALQILFSGTNEEIWLLSMAGVPSLLAGIVVGQLLFKRISQNTFRRFTYIILLFTGVYLMMTSF